MADRERPNSGAGSRQQAATRRRIDNGNSLEAEFALLMSPSLNANDTGEGGDYLSFPDGEDDDGALSALLGEMEGEEEGDEEGDEGGEDDALERGDAVGGDEQLLALLGNANDDVHGGGEEASLHGHGEEEEVADGNGNEEGRDDDVLPVGGPPDGPGRFYIYDPDVPGRTMMPVFIKLTNNDEEDPVLYVPRHGELRNWLAGDNDAWSGHNGVLTEEGMRIPLGDHVRQRDGVTPVPEIWMYPQDTSSGYSREYANMDVLPLISVYQQSEAKREKDRKMKTLTNGGRGRNEKIFAVSATTALVKHLLRCATASMKKTVTVNLVVNGRNKEITIRDHKEEDGGERITMLGSKTLPGAFIWTTGKRLPLAKKNNPKQADYKKASAEYRASMVGFFANASQRPGLVGFGVGLPQDCEKQIAKFLVDLEKDM